MLEGAPAPDQSAVAEAPAEVETQVDETVNLEATPEVSEPEAAPVEDDSEEVEYEGNKYRLPKELKDAFLRQSDYTRKTQEVAEQRRTFEAEQSAFKQQSEVAQRHIQDIASVYSLNAQIASLEAEYAKAQQDGDFIKTGELYQQRGFLIEQRNGLASQIQANEQRVSQEAQQTFAKRYAETNAQLAKEIKGWSEVAPKVAAFAQENGVTQEELRVMATNPHLAKLVHKAYLGDQLVNAKTVQAKTADPPVQAKPITKVSGTGAKPAVNLATADMDTYIAERKKQGYGKR